MQRIGTQDEQSKEEDETRLIVQNFSDSFWQEENEFYINNPQVYENTNWEQLDFFSEPYTAEAEQTANNEVQKKEDEYQPDLTEPQKQEEDTANSETDNSRKRKRDDGEQQPEKQARVSSFSVFPYVAALPKIPTQKKRSFKDTRYHLESILGFMTPVEDNHSKAPTYAFYSAYNSLKSSGKATQAWKKHYYFVNKEMMYIKPVIIGINTIQLEHEQQNSRHYAITSQHPSRIEVYDLTQAYNKLLSLEPPEENFKKIPQLQWLPTQTPANYPKDSIQPRNNPSRQLTGSIFLMNPPPTSTAPSTQQAKLALAPPTDFTMTRK